MNAEEKLPAQAHHPHICWAPSPARAPCSARGERMAMINQGLQEMLNVCGPAEPGVAAVCSEDLGLPDRDGR